jgi:hypothetical protein
MACAGGGGRRCRQTRRRGRYLADPIQSTEVRRGRGVGIQVPPNRIASLGQGEETGHPDFAIRVSEDGGRMRVWMPAGQQLVVYISQSFIDQ